MEKRKLNKNEQLEKSKTEDSTYTKEMNEDELSNVSGGLSFGEAFLLGKAIGSLFKKRK